MTVRPVRLSIPIFYALYLQRAYVPAQESGTYDVDTKLTLAQILGVS